jgi:hypothetical protein
MGIVQNIPRKQGRVNLHPEQRVVSNQVFGPRGAAGANVGDVTNPGNPAYLTQAGKDYNNQISSTGGSTNPVGTHSNTATQLDIPALTTQDVTTVVLQHQAVDVQPHEKGKFFSAQTGKTNPQRVSGGVDPNSNTAFHPKTASIQRQPRYPNKESARLSVASFGTTGVLGISQQQPQQPANGASRWSKVKRSVSDNAVKHHGTLAGPSSKGHVVGSGTTGVTSTKGRGRVVVNNNAHPAQSINVYPWVPNQRSEQPSERGNTNPSSCDTCDNC